MNLLSPEIIVAAAQLIRTGEIVPCSRPLSGYNPLGRPPGFKHEMLSAWQSVAGGNVQASSDRISVVTHGMTNTHMDALCHVGWDGRGFNGLPFEQMVNMEDGAVVADITDALAVTTRGVIADIPRQRQIEYLEPGDAVRVDELRAATPDLQPGDALLVRTGHWLAPEDAATELEVDNHGRHAGLHAECMEYVLEKDVIVLGTDGPGDTFPSPLSECPLPIHVLALAYIGVPLIHNMNLDLLAETCTREGRNSFFFVVTSLHIEGGTGSPVTPIAIF